MTRKQASTIFKARTRMTKVKGNYKNEFPDLMYRACKTHPETQAHALSDCENIHNNNSASTENTKIKCDYTDLFSEFTFDLKDVATKIENICEKLIEME